MPRLRLAALFVLLLAILAVPAPSISAHGYASIATPRLAGTAAATSQDDLPALETRLEAAVETALDATVGLRVRRRRGLSGSGTGVIVSPQGHILTVGHLPQRAGERFTVVFSDGREVSARALGRNNAGDYALLQITEANDEPWPYAVMAKSSDVVVDQLCFMAGHPSGIRSDSQPIIRFGSVVAQTADWIQSSCIIMPGDSGGPLFDMHGRVIGINSWIGFRSTQNYSVPVDKPQADWDRLIDSEVWGTADWERGAAGEVPGFRRRGRGRRGRGTPAPVDPRLDRADVIAGGLKPAMLKQARQTLDTDNGDFVVRLRSRRNGTDTSILGVVLDDDGHILTKASELGDHITCTLADGNTHACTLASIDTDTDLALLRVDDPAEAALEPIRWADHDLWIPGQLVLSPGTQHDVLGVGVVGAVPYKVPPSGSGFLGVVLDRTADVGGALIEEVMDDTAASMVGLLDGDIVVSLDGDPVSDAQSLISELSQRNVGDVLWLEVHRPEPGGDPAKMTPMSLRVQLNGRPLQLTGNGGHAADQVPVSGRRGAFPKAIRHDTLLKPSDCGGPILDSHGLAVGMNIARLNRTGSLALPVDIVREALVRLYIKAAVGSE